MKNAESETLSTYLTPKEERYLQKLRREQKKERRVFVVFALLLFFLAAWFLG